MPVRVDKTVLLYVVIVGVKYWGLNLLTTGDTFLTHFGTREEPSLWFLGRGLSCSFIALPICVYTKRTVANSCLAGQNILGSHRHTAFSFTYMGPSYRNTFIPICHTHASSHARIFTTVEQWDTATLSMKYGIRDSQSEPNRHIHH